MSFYEEMKDGGIKTSTNKHDSIKTWDNKLKF